MEFNEFSTNTELLNIIRVLLEQRGGTAFISDREIVDVDKCTEIIMYRDETSYSWVLEVRDPPKHNPTPVTIKMINEVAEKYFKPSPPEYYKPSKYIS